MRKSGLVKLLSVILAFGLIFTLNGAGLVYAFSGSPNRRTDFGSSNSFINPAGETETDASLVSPYVSTDNEDFTELVGKREESAKYFLLESKRYEAVLYGVPVHYLDDGIYKDIDNSLVLTTDKDDKSVYTNRANSFEASFVASLGDGWFAGISKDGYVMKWRLEGTGASVNAVQSNPLSLEEWNTLSKGQQRRTMPNISSSVIFTDAMQGVYLQYQLISNMVKENIIITARSETNTYVQTISLQGLVLLQNNDKSIVAVDAQNASKVIFDLPAPFAYDSSSEYTSNIDVTLNETNNSANLFDGAEKTYTLTYTIDKTWLDSATYPVTIDPSVKTGSSDVNDTRINDANPNTNMSAYNITATGYGSSSHKNRALVQFSNLPSIESTNQIVYAGFWFKKGGATTTNSYISVHEMLQPWSASTITWNLFLALDPNNPNNTDPNLPTIYNPRVEDYKLASDSAGVWHEWDITRVAKKWYSGSSQYGLLIKDMTESSSVNNYKDWYTKEYSSGYAPYLYIVYNSFAGLENYWEYATSSLGRSGTAYTNLYTGSLVYSHVDLAMNGSRLPITISHVFDSTLRNSNDSKMLYGNGWRTNYDQRVSYVTINTINYYKYTDGDGTEHYFKYDTTSGDWTYQAWADESSQDRKMTIASNVPTITDKKGNKLVFYATNDANKPGFLNYIQDSFGNTQTVGYDANHRISQITDGAGRVVYLTRDANNYLEKIREEVSSGVYRETTFTYDSSRLIRITYPDSKHTDFVYDANGFIDNITGIDSKKVDLTYTSSQVTFMGESATVDSVTEYGNELTITYGINNTKVTDSEDRTVAYQFDDSGHMVSVIGPDGSASYSKVGITNTNNESTNKPTSLSVPQRFGKNYLLNSGMEMSNGWTLYSGSSYDTSQKYMQSRSIKLIASTGVVYAGQTVNLPKGKTYTLSGYIKTSSVTDNANIQAVYYNTSGSTTTVLDGEFVTGTKDWSRYWITFSIPSDAYSGDVTVNLLLGTGTGTAYIDCMQLEEGSIPNRYNIIDNADFDYATSGVPTNWTKSTDCTTSDTVITTTDDSNPSNMSDNRFEFIGAPNKAKYIEQVLNLSGSTDDCYVVGGWAKGNGIPIHDDDTTLKYGYAIRFDYTSIADEWVFVRFSEDVDDWQFACVAAVAKGNYQSIKIRVEIDYGANSIDFDAVQMYKDDFGRSFVYDINGNMTSRINGSREETFQYNTSNDMTKFTDAVGNDIDYTYYTNHRLQTSTSMEGVVTTYNYDSYGNCISTEVGNTTNYIKSNTSMDSNYNYVDSTTDPFGKDMEYTFDPYKGTLTDVTDPLSNTLYNTYDSNTDLLTSVSLTSGSTTMSNSYLYTNDRLSQVSHNSPSGNVAFDILYNTLGWNTGTKVGTQDIVSYDLEENTGRLNSITYGNGQTVSYVYDVYDRLIKVSQGTSDLYMFEYNNCGKLGYIKDYGQDAEYWYEYVNLELLGMITKKDSSGKSVTTYTFDDSDKNTSFKETISGTDYETNYTYDGDNRPDSSTFGTYSKNITYSAALGRMSNVTLKNGANTIYSTSLSYFNGDGINSVDSARIASIVNGNETLSYTYDDRGYITQVYKDEDNYSQYFYDDYGQLVRENYIWGTTSQTMIFAYDVGGNITSKTLYDFVADDGQVGTPIDTLAYTYDNTWKDKLATFGGNGITYDNIGNPLDDGTWTYTWTQGRRLASITDGSSTVSYQYNDSGVRTEKTVNSVTTKYNVVGRRVTWQKTGTNNPIYFVYDSSGKLWGLKYTDGNMYFYVRNVQGDIHKIVNASGTVVVEYTYDAWGNPMGTTGSMAGTLGAENPFRYRGYYFDTETGLYYLQSRFYNPQWGRFVNADSSGGFVGGLLSHNVFTYCKNNPIVFSDPSGYAYIVTDDNGEIVVANPNEPSRTFTAVNRNASSSIDYATYIYRKAIGPSDAWINMSPMMRKIVLLGSEWIIGTALSYGASKFFTTCAFFAKTARAISAYTAAGTAAGVVTGAGVLATTISLDEWNSKLLNYDPDTFHDPNFSFDFSYVDWSQFAHEYDYHGN